MMNCLVSQVRVAHLRTTYLFEPRCRLMMLSTLLQSSHVDNQHTLQSLNLYDLVFSVVSMVHQTTDNGSKTD